MSRGELAAAFSKLEGGAARFALLHHVVTHVARGESDLVPMEAESIEAGAVLCRWFAREAQRIYSLLNESEEARETRKLVEFIQARGGRITTKELQKSNSRKYSDAETATQDLDRLVQTGLGYWQDRPTDSKGGRPTRDFFLHPTTDDTDETPGAAPAQDGATSDATSDNTLAPSDDTPQNSGQNGVSSVSSVVGSKAKDSPQTEQVNPGAREGIVGRPQVSSEGFIGTPMMEAFRKARPLPWSKWWILPGAPIGDWFRAQPTSPPSYRRWTNRCAWVSIRRRPASIPGPTGSVC